MGNLWQVSLQVKIGAVFFGMTANANRVVDYASRWSFARTLPVHLSRRRVLKFCMAVNALNPTLFDFSHHSPYAELKGMTSQAIFVHPLPFN